MRDIDAWLHGLNLARYSATFRKHGIDGVGLAKLSDFELEKLGIPLGHRRLILKAIQLLKAPPTELSDGRTSARQRVKQGEFGAQRRQLTVMFCDLIGSTELSSRLDPEEMHELVAAYHQCCTELIEGSGGFVAKYLGDGVLAYFGYPRAHEDDPERAIQAALQIRNSTPKLPTRHGEQLAVRIGIATGLVVVGELVGEGWAQERAVVGETPNLAARIQTLAQPNQVVVSNMTRRLAAGLFEYRDLGQPELKGLTVHDSVWEVVGTNTLTDRFQARHTVEPAPMLGREDELRSILALWRRAQTGGHVVGIVGDAGIGKSRLIYELHKQISGESHRWVEGGAAHIFSNTPFYTLSQMIRRSLASNELLSDAEYAKRLEVSLGEAGLNVTEALPLVAEAIGISTSDHDAPLTISAGQRRENLIAAVFEWLSHLAERLPTIVVIEDIHWVDPSTLEVLDLLVERVPSNRILIIYSARTGYAPRWPLGDHHTQVFLERLDRDSVRRLVVATAGQDFEPSLINKLLSRAEGVPLFAEELARLMADHAGARSDREIPATLSDLLTARLDGLGRARETAQVASVLGREFPVSLMQAISGSDSETLQSSLARLVDAEILVANRDRPEVTYSFKHALLEDAAYEGLLKSQRRALHHRTATVIAGEFPEVAASRPEVLAQHWERADEPDLSAVAWQRAGRLAVSRRALREAQLAYERGIITLRLVTESPDRDARELALQSSLAGVLQITTGYSAPRTVEATSRAHQLAVSGGKLSQQLRQAITEWAASSSGGDYFVAVGMADHILQLAKAEGSSASLAQAYMAQMTSRYRVGELIEAEENFNLGSIYFGSPEFRRRPGVVAQTFGNAALVAWIMGDEVEARRRMASAISVSEDVGHPYDFTFARSMSAVLALLTSDFLEAEAAAHRAIALCQEHGFPQLEPISRIVMGRARAASGRTAESISLIREGLRQMTETSSRVAMTEYLTWLSEVHALDGALDSAIETADEALRINPQELFFRPESLRLRGEFLLAKGNFAKAEVDFLEAISLSKRMGAKQFHARATASLNRLGERRGDRAPK